MIESVGEKEVISAVNGMVRISIIKVVTVEFRHEKTEGVGHVDIQRKSILGRTSSQCKGPEVGLCPVHSRNKEVPGENRNSERHIAQCSLQRYLQ